MGGDGGDVSQFGVLRIFGKERWDLASILWRMWEGGA